MRKKVTLEASKVALLWEKVSLERKKVGILVKKGLLWG